MARFGRNRLSCPPLAPGLLWWEGGRRDARLFFFQAEDGIRDDLVTGVQTCALPIFPPRLQDRRQPHPRDHRQKEQHHRERGGLPTRCGSGEDVVEVVEERGADAEEDRKSVV